MKNITKQVVILDNFTSPYIHQAILILKDYDPALDDKIIEEAEKVVSKYLTQPQYNVKKRNAALPRIIWSLAIISFLAVVLIYVI